MKTSLLLLALSCSALGLSARAADSAATTFGEIPVQSIAARVKANGDDVTVDTPRVAVALRLGSPTAVLADGTWLYRDYVMRRGARDTGRPVTLVIRFQADQVSQLTLADRAAVLALRSAPSLPRADRIFVADRSRR